MKVCAFCGVKEKIYKNGLCKECRRYLIKGWEDDFVNVCPTWWKILEATKGVEKKCVL